MTSRNPRGYASTVKNGRAFAEYLGGTKIRFTAEKCGHVYVKDFGKGPVSRRLGIAGTQMMASWWSKEKGGCVATCPKCEKSKE